jgi:hypothetical protein
MTTERYLSRIASQHIDKPKFTAFVDLYASACVDIQSVLFSLITEFDLDFAIGKQLDTVGEWIGQSRAVSILVEQIYFTWDLSVPKGWDNGVWRGIGDPDNEQVILDDDTYRRLLKSKVLSNIWKGDMASIYAIFDAFVTPTTPIYVLDNQDMSMTVQLMEGSMGVLDLKIITSGLILVKPAGVRINYDVIPIPPSPQLVSENDIDLVSENDILLLASP